MQAIYQAGGKRDSETDAKANSGTSPCRVRRPFEAAVRVRNTILLEKSEEIY